MNYLRVLLKKPYFFKYILFIALIAVFGVVYSISLYFKSVNTPASDDFQKISTSNQTKENPDNIFYDKEDDNESIYVFICGYINNPGVYCVKEGTRLYSLLEMSGGFNESAAKDYHNLARVLKDGERIYIPSVTDLEENSNANMFTDDSQYESNVNNSLININSADANELMKLPGIGEGKANDIVKYRDENGRFSTIEDIMKVSGIKEALFEKLKDFICVR